MGMADELERLEGLRQRGVLSEEEFARAKAAVLAGQVAPSPEPLTQHLAQQFGEVRQQNALADLDRQWQLERDKYMLRNRYGVRQMPTRGGAIAAILFGGGFGLLWTIMAFAITASAPNEGPFPVAKVVFPLLGVGITVFAIGSGVYGLNQAQAYEEAEQRYRAMREEILARDVAR